MISLVFLLSLLWLGFVLDEEFNVTRGDFLLRLAAAIILGCFWSTWLVYLLAWCSSGLRAWTVADATGIILLVNFYAWKKRGRNLAWFARLLFVDRAFWRVYFIFPALITAFFLTGLWVGRDGAIRYHGNFTDLAFHMGTVSAFLEQTAFPPLNPQSAAAKLSYHFMADFYAAVLCKGGFSLFASLKVPMVMFAFSLSSLLCLFYQRVLKDNAAAVFACILFLFGHIGGFNLVFGLLGYPVGNEPLFPLSWTSIEEHLAFPYFNFLNVLVDFFEPQLPFLFGFPFALLILLVLYRKFSEREPFNASSYFIVGSVALLPLFHMHSFLVLAPLTGLWLLAELWSARGNVSPSPVKFYEHVPVKLLGLLLAVTAVGLQFAFILSQKKAPGFSGWDVSERLNNLSEIPDFLHARRVLYWVRAAGLPFVLGLIGFFHAPSFKLRARDPDQRANLALLAMFGLTTAYFLLINFYRFTPSWGDSNKFFLYWDVMLCLYAGRVLSGWWESSRSSQILAAALILFGAILPFADEWSLRYRRGPSTLFTAGDQMAADWIKANTPKDAIFLTANSYTHFVPALAGRRVVNGSYTRETGFADDKIEGLVARAYRESNPGLIDTVKVTHILVGPDEKNQYFMSRSAMEHWHPMIFDQNWRGLRYSVYEAKNVSPEEFAAEKLKGDLRGFVWLSEQAPAFVQQFGNLQYDESFDMTPLKLNEKTYPSGLGTHAPSELRFDLDGKYLTFQSDVGIDDTESNGIGSVIFRVKVDDKVVYSSAVLRGRSRRETVSVDVSGAKTLTLLVEDAGDGNHNDHADWAGAKLIRKP